MSSKTSAPTIDTPKLRPTRTAGRGLGLPKRPAGTVYRGREGMWSWVLHRVTGVSIYFFLLVHILDTALVRVSPAAYDAVIATYKTPLMGLGELVLIAAIGFHALNGLRIILFDFWSQGVARQRQMLWVQTVLFLALAIPPVIAIGAHVVEEL